MMLVQSVLFFVLGVVTTAFLVMLVAPFLWRRALLLAGRMVRSEVPLSLAEVEADRDFLRARHAVDLCRLEERLKAEQAAHVKRRTGLDSARERIQMLARLEPLCAGLQEKIRENERLIDRQKQKLGSYERRIAEISTLKAQCAAQKKQLQEQRRKINRLETGNEKLKQRLRADSVVDRKALRTLRNQIKVIAAEVAAGVAKDAGEDSPIRQLTADAADGHSLAALIRSLTQKTKTKSSTKSQGAVRRMQETDRSASARARTG